MFNTNNIVAFIALIIALLAIFANTNSPAVGTSYDRTTFTNPITFSDAVTHSGAVTLSSTLTSTGAVATQEFTQGGGILQFTATSTQSARTVTATELATYNVIEIVATASPALTLTLPSTSTLTAVIPNAGDMREWFIDNQQAAATTTTIVAGTGIDLIAVTANDDVIDGVEKARLTCWRKYNTDVACIVSELLAAD